MDRECLNGARSKVIEEFIDLETLISVIHHALSRASRCRRRDKLYEGNIF
jgi:hypothetical protein